MTDPILEALNRAAEDRLRMSPEAQEEELKRIIAYLRKARGSKPTKTGAEPIDLVAKLHEAGAIQSQKIPGLRRI